MAKRIQFAAYGGPEVLEYRDYQPAEPGPREVRVRNRAIGLNFIDTYYRSGLYPAPGLPSGLGSEGAGEVEGRHRIGDNSAGCDSRARAQQWYRGTCFPWLAFRPAVVVPEHLTMIRADTHERVVGLAPRLHLCQH